MCRRIPDSTASILDDAPLGATSRTAVLVAGRSEFAGLDPAPSEVGLKLSPLDGEGPALGPEIATGDEARTLLSLRPRCWATSLIVSLSPSRATGRRVLSRSSSRPSAVNRYVVGDRGTNFPQ